MADAPQSSSPYPGSTEYAILMRRFKLLSLVQRVAHRDVMEMVDTVGLDVLAYKGAARQRWMRDVAWDTPPRPNPRPSRTPRAVPKTRRRDVADTTRPRRSAPTRLTRTQEQRLLRRLAQPRHTLAVQTPPDSRATSEPTAWHTPTSATLHDDDAAAVPTTAAALARTLLPRPTPADAGRDVPPLPPAPDLPTTTHTSHARVPLAMIQRAAAAIAARPHVAVSPPPQPPPQPETAPVAEAETASTLPQTLQQLSTAVDTMLQDHWRVLQEVVRQPGAAKPSSDTAAPPARPAAATTRDAAVEVDMTDAEASDQDEARLLTRLHEKVARMDAEAAQMAQRSTTAPVAVPRATPSAARRRRGTMPEAVVQRLMAHRLENYEYIAYNERLWNTSSTSQFVFAQRLTNALFEDCLDEVLAEVTSIMDHYVEGLAEHELQ